MSKSLAFIEIKHSATGDLDASDATGHPSYVARMVRSDAKLAEAFALDRGDLELLEQIRCFQRRGNMTKVNTLIDALKSTPGFSTHQSDVFLEESRMHCYRGHWQQALAAAEAGIQEGASGTTLLTLMQVCALACFECGSFSAAQNHLDAAHSLAKLYPYAALPFYLSAVQIKLLLAESKHPSAVSLLSRCWERAEKQTDINADILLTLLRAELEVARQRKLQWLEFALSSYILAHSMGEDLYKALAVADLFTGSDADGRAFWQSEMDSASKSFERIARLAQQDKSGDVTSTSARWLAASWETQVFQKTPVQVHEIRRIWLLERGFRIDLETLTVEKVRLPRQLRAAFYLLTRKSLSKAELFAEIWNRPNFVPHLHEQVIKTLLHRLRKATGARIVQDQGRISIPNEMVHL